MGLFVACSWKFQSSDIFGFGVALKHRSPTRGWIGNPDDFDGGFGRSLPRPEVSTTPKGTHNGWTLRITPGQEIFRCTFCLASVKLRSLKINEIKRKTNMEGIKISSPNTNPNIIELSQ